ncbi:MAG: hypothetical protein M0D57_13335 [Sphingobacteriales bacterium JAD_PAG50586_3]|nr:MAG: hypothetical protein M0D57_13335 [Sphingobacteriales bacterium JAD_PAG50586_3]
MQINQIDAMSGFCGPNFSFRANHKYGRFAGIFNLSYNFGNTFKAINYDWFFNYLAPKHVYVSTIRYNFLKVGAAMQVPIINRTNKKGFCLSAIIGASYYNGLGSGEYINYLDRNPGKYFGSQWHTGNSRNFSFSDHNLEMISIEAGLDFSYTFSRYQLFSNFSLLNCWSINDVYDEYSWYQTNGTYTSKTESSNKSTYDTPRYSFCLNIGLRYCLYNPWQTTPPDRVLRY